jgi:hypothetical protein
MAEMGLRAGNDPRAVVTTTPRPIPIVRTLLADHGTIVTRGTTYDNAANLPLQFLRRILRRYEGTRLGRQELLAELLDDVPGALWTRDIIEKGRNRRGNYPELVRIVVSVDPATTSGENANETGIVVAGRDARRHGYVLADRSGHYTPAGWAREAIRLYREFGADRIGHQRRWRRSGRWLGDDHDRRHGAIALWRRRADQRVSGLQQFVGSDLRERRGGRERRGCQHADRRRRDLHDARRLQAGRPGQHLGRRDEPGIRSAPLVID